MSAQGLETKMREVVGELNAARRRPFNPTTKKWEPTTLNGYLAARGLKKQHLYAGLGIDARATTFGDLYALDNQQGAYLASEIIYDAMMAGAGMQHAAEANLAPQTSYNDVTNPIHRVVTPENIRPYLMQNPIEEAIYMALVAGQAPTPSETVTAPYIDATPVRGSVTAEGATIEMSNFKLARKDVKCEKVTTGIEVTYETLQSATLDIVGTFFRLFGGMHAAKKNGRLMSVIVNGNPNTADSAPVIGIGTANTLIDKDIYRPRQRMALCGFTPNVVAASEETGLVYLDLPAIKNNQFNGTAILPVTPRIGVLGASDYFASSDLAANRLLFHNSRAAIMEYQWMAPMVETDKIINKQITETVFSESQCFVKQVRQASVLVASDLAFIGNGWPSYMQPLRSA